METFEVLSGTWYRITAPDLETAEEVYDAYWNDEVMPEGCTIKEGEVDSFWIPVSLDGPELSFEEYKKRHTPNETTLEAMKEVLGD